MTRNEIKELLKAFRASFPLAYAEYEKSLKAFAGYMDAEYAFKYLAKAKEAVQNYALKSVKITIGDPAFESAETLKKDLRNVFFYHEKMLVAKANAPAEIVLPKFVPRQMSVFEAEGSEQEPEGHEVSAKEVISQPYRKTPEISEVKRKNLNLEGIPDSELAGMRSFSSLLTKLRAA